VVIAGVIIFVGYASAGRIFVKPETIPHGMMLILALSVTGLLSFVYFSIAHAHSALLMLAALALMAASTGLFIWTVQSISSRRLNLAFVKTEPSTFLTSGAYHYIRHPLYLAYVLYWIGASIATLHWSTILISVLLIAVYVAAARFEEGQFLASELAGAYHHYQKRAGFLWPCLL
jgi:protein-S-isoprenylcysteine O-methyltransferase Ste14